MIWKQLIHIVSSQIKGTKLVPTDSSNFMIMENFNGDREGYMRYLDQTAETKHREQRHRNIYDMDNSSRFDRREDNQWSTREHGHNSYEQQFNRHYGEEESKRFPESGTNYDMRGMHSGKGPRNYRRSDERLKELICERLTADPHVDATDIVIEVRDSEAIIGGTVNDKQMKRRAEEIIDEIKGITQVENRIRVNKP
jgi:osmotically-inducible protein OsmY